MTTELENWRELAKTTKLGWPEWEEDHIVLRLRFGGVACLVQLRTAQEWIHSHTISDHEAQCLFERHAQGRLAGWGIYLGRFEGQFYAARDIGGEAEGITEVLCKDGQIREADGIAEIAHFAKEIAALQAAVRAAEEEGKEST